MGESKTTSTSSTESKYCPQQEIDKLTAESKASESQPENQSDHHEEDDLEEGWKMTNSMLEAMKRSTWLKNELKDAGLRQLVLKIMRASDLARRNKSRTKQEEELDQAKADFPRFKKFIDKLLVLTGILERHGDEASIDLDEWLEKEQAVDGLSSDTQLILKPISWPTRNPTVAKEIAESNEEQIDVAATASTSEDSGDDSSDDDSSSSSDDDDEDSSSHGNKNV